MGDDPEGLSAAGSQGGWQAVAIKMVELNQSAQKEEAALTYIQDRLQALHSAAEQEGRDPPVPRITGLLQSYTEDLQGQEYMYLITR